MSFDWDKLQPNFRDKCKLLLDKLKQQGILIVPYSGYRSLEEQAKLWRQGRTSKEIHDKINGLISGKCSFLAHQILKVGPQMQKKIVTNAIPGTSWHNWGYGLDCYATHNNDPKQPNWDGNNKDYMELAKAAEDLDLTSGMFFKIKDCGHIQFYDKEVTNLFSIKQINDQLEKRENQNG